MSDEIKSSDEGQFVFDEKIDKVEKGLEALKNTGVSFDDLAEYFIDSEKPEKQEVIQVKKRFNDFIKTQQQEKLKQEAEQKKQAQVRWNNTLQATINSSEDFPFIKAMNISMEDIVNFGAEVFEKDPENKDIWNPEKLVSLFESQLVEKYKPLFQNDKVKKKVIPEPEVDYSKLSNRDRVVMRLEGKLKTLTDKVIDTSNNKPPEPKKYLSEDERKENVRRLLEKKFTEE